jgi:hypothetical protein
MIIDNDRRSAVENYWDQWPLINDDLVNEDKHFQMDCVDDVDRCCSPEYRLMSTVDRRTSSKPNEMKCHPNVIRSLPLSSLNERIQPAKNKTTGKRTKTKKPMSEYRPPSPSSPKPDYKSMTIEQLKTNATRYGLLTSQSKGRLIKILDEIYRHTHQYETDTDYDYDVDERVERVGKADRCRTPPTPAVMPDVKKVRTRAAVHQMSSSDEEVNHRPAAIVRTKTPTLFNADNDDPSDDSHSDHEGRFLELTVHELSSSTSSSHSLSTIGTSADEHRIGSKRKTRFVSFSSCHNRFTG